MKRRKMTEVVEMELKRLKVIMVTKISLKCSDQLRSCIVQNVIETALIENMLLFSVKTQKFNVNQIQSQFRNEGK